MLDIHFVRENPDAVKENQKKRLEDPALVDKILKKDEEWRKSKKEREELRKTKNDIGKEIAELKKAKKDASTKIGEMDENKKKMEKADHAFKTLLAKRDQLLMQLPNLLAPGVPEGDSTSFKVLRENGKATNKKVETHGEFAERLDLAEFVSASKIAGEGFVYIKNDLALLDQALVTFARDELLKKGFTLIIPPLMINRKSYEGVTDLSAFDDVIYKIEGEDLYLIATSEHAIAAMRKDDVLDEEALPMKFVGISPCFRKEIGGHGVDTKGLFRMHQFNKVEQFVFCKPKQSQAVHEELIKNAEKLFAKLELPYRTIELASGDLSAVSAKTYDIEAWSPRQQKYVEIVSGSNCTDYQARRLNIKYGKRGGETQLVNTLNCTAIATSRAMVAILENFQEKDRVKIPKVLWPYMNGKKEITKN